MLTQPAQERKYLSSREVEEYLTRITDGRNCGMLERQARGMGLSLDSLITMQATYDQDKAVVVFPMFDHRRMPIGCRYRRFDSRKWALKGGREGVFLSRDFTTRQLVWVAEGPTDSAALTEIGFRNVVGRPNCTGGADIIRLLLARSRQTPIIIVADPDEVGKEGAISLAQNLPNPVIAIVGPCDIRDFATKRLKSDARAAILNGVTGDEVDTWQPAFCNRAGQFYDFLGALRWKD